jgi:hypothetical protein
LFFFFLLFHALMMLDLSVDAHDAVESESHPVSAPVELLQIYILPTPDVLLVSVLGILDSYFSFPAVLLGSSPWHFVTLRRFCNPSSGG